MKHTIKEETKNQLKQLLVGAMDAARESDLRRLIWTAQIHDDDADIFRSLVPHGVIAVDIQRWSFSEYTTVTLHFNRHKVLEWAHKRRALYKMYVLAELTCREIGDASGYHYVTIYKRLQKFSIATRKRQRDDLRTHEMYREYISNKHITLRDIGAKHGMTWSGVQKRFKREGLELKPKGRKYGQTKKSAPHYHTCHKRVYKLKGKPKECEICGTTDPRRTYDWANMTGDYENTDDYKRLCRSCHKKLDWRRKHEGDPYSKSAYNKAWEAM